MSTGTWWVDDERTVRSLDIINIDIDFVKVVHYIDCDKVLLRVVGDGEPYELEQKLQQRVVRRG